jgi:hypothetical protein
MMRTGGCDSRDRNESHLQANVVIAAFLRIADSILLDLNRPKCRAVDPTTGCGQKGSLQHERISLQQQAGEHL